ncbi:MAG TPA: FHA domain-containing protein [Anaerolineales bacterium]|nr:FHA domain-containing protein [Anaerolineales bacterium]
MRKFLITIFSLSLLFGWSLPVRAQAQAAAILYPADVSGFPAVSAFLDVFDASGAFVGGLRPGDVNVVEDGRPLPITALTELDIPIQVVVAVNPGPALGLRDTTGAPRFQWITQALTAWAQARPGGQQDDLSLVTLAGSIVTHAGAKDWLASLNAFQPNFQATTPNLQSLAIALDTAAAGEAHSGTKRAVLFITPHMDDPNVDSELQPLIQQAVQNRIHVFVWLADLDAYQATTSAAAFSQLAEQTGGAFYFSSGKDFPDPETYFAPLRKLYLLKYASAVTTGGQHTLSVQVIHAGAVIKSGDQTFSVDIQPPNPILVSPPLQITRQPPADDPYNTQVLVPTTQELDVIIEFPDGHTRPLASTTLYVDGQAVAQNSKPPFDKFMWDVSGFTMSGVHNIAVEAVDTFGQRKTSMAIPVTFTVVQAPHGIPALFAKYHQYITYGAIGFAGIALLLILLITRLQLALASARKTRRADADPLTQPVAIAVESSAAANRKRARPRSARLKPINAPATLVRLGPGPAAGSGQALEPLAGSPIPLVENEITFGTDPVQSSIVLDDLSIAARHARLTQTGPGTFHIRDEGTVGGTWVNYDPIGTEGRTLQHGDVIHFGQLAFRFELKNPPVAKEPKITREKTAV